MRRSTWVAATALAVAAALTLAACSGGSGGSTPAVLGTVPIPTAPASPIIPTASAGHAQLVATGDTVLLDLPDGSRALATVSGPSLDTPTAAGAAPAKQVTGQLTVTVVAQSGSVPVSASVFTVRDELGRSVPVIADRASAIATAAAPAVLHLTGVFSAGDTNLTWSLSGHALATWDFQVELD